MPGLVGKLRGGDGKAHLEGAGYVVVWCGIYVYIYIYIQLYDKYIHMYMYTFILRYIDMKLYSTYIPVLEYIPCTVDIL